MQTLDTAAKTVYEIKVLISGEITTNKKGQLTISHDVEKSGEFNTVTEAQLWAEEAAHTPVKSDQSSRSYYLQQKTAGADEFAFVGLVISTGDLTVKYPA